MELLRIKIMEILITIITYVVFAAILFFITRFLRKFKPKPKAKNVHFKSNAEAFKFASQLHSINYQANTMYFGIVKETSQLKDGSYQFLIQLADPNRVIFVNGYNDKYPHKISIGNLVYWGYVDETDPNPFHIEAVGHILATLHPEYDPNNFKWSIKENLTNK